MNAAPLLLPGTLCGAALWAGAALPPGAQVLPAVRGASLCEAAKRALDVVPGPLHLVGFSLGAMVAFEMLRLAPERVEKLTLISANPHPPSAAQRSLWDAQAWAVRAGRFEAVVAQMVHSAGHHQAAVLDMALQLGPAIFLEQLQLLCARPDSRPTLDNWHGPLSILVGEADQVTPPALAREMVQLAPQAELQVIPGAGHYLPLDAPQAVTDALRAVAYV